MLINATEFLIEPLQLGASYEADDIRNKIQLNLDSGVDLNVTAALIQLLRIPMVWSDYVTTRSSSHSPYTINNALGVPVEVSVEDSPGMLELSDDTTQALDLFTRREASNPHHLLKSAKQATSSLLDQRGRKVNIKFGGNFKSLNMIPINVAEITLSSAPSQINVEVVAIHRLSVSAMSA